jgi:hypothetical protein
MKMMPSRKTQEPGEKDRYWQELSYLPNTSGPSSSEQSKQERVKEDRKQVEQTK